MQINSINNIKYSQSFHGAKGNGLRRPTQAVLNGLTDEIIQTGRALQVLPPNRKNIREIEKLKNKLAELTRRASEILYSSID